MPENLFAVNWANINNFPQPQQVNPQNIEPIINEEEVNEEGGKVLHTIGVELESLGLSKKNVSKIVSNLPSSINGNFGVTHDASTELNVYLVPLGGKEYVAINRHTNDARELFERHMHTETYGYELVSKPLSRENLEFSLWNLLPKLESSGDFLSDRCATHIHVGINKDVKLLKKLLRLGLWADELFYSLSGMGRKFRGYCNNAVYARPLISGQCINWNGAYYQILNWRKALDAKNLSEFFAAYCMNIHKEAIKYHPARYFSLNLYSVLLHKTIEFRHFNQSFDPGLVSSVAKLCQLFVEVGIKASENYLEDLEPGNVFETYRPGHYLDILYRLVSMGRELNCNYNISSQDIGILEDVIYTYKGIGIKDIPILSHLKEVNIDPDMIISGELIKTKSKPIHSGFIDIHNIKNASIINKEIE